MAICLIILGCTNRSDLGFTQSQLSCRRQCSYNAQMMVTQPQLMMALRHDNVLIICKGTIQHGPGLSPHFLKPRLQGGTRTPHYSTQWLVSRMSGEAVYLSVTSFRFMLSAVTLSANCPGRAPYWDNKSRGIVEVLNEAEGKQRSPLPLN